MVKKVKGKVSRKKKGVRGRERRGWRKWLFVVLIVVLLLFLVGLFVVSLGEDAVPVSGQVVRNDDVETNTQQPVVRSGSPPVGLVVSG